MLSNETQMVIAENCSEYESRYINVLSNTGGLARSCINCVHHSDGRCMKELSKGMIEQINLN